MGGAERNMLSGFDREEMQPVVLGNNSGPFAEWGTPVIGTTAGGIPEIVDHNRSGLLVPPKDEMALAAAIRRLLDEPETRRAFGAAGQRRVESVVSADKMATGMERLYRQAIAYRSLSLAGGGHAVPRLARGLELSSLDSTPFPSKRV